jgi:2,4-dienoyl-CoA reductase-like NADH-dependent reductase (Old Yellow Enzyme family)
MTIHYLNGKDSGLFKPLTISNGNITLEHRVVHAPLTRNRGEPLNPISTPDQPNRIWIPGDAVVEYYSQRATKGGLMISEGIPPSLEVSISNSIWWHKVFFRITNLCDSLRNRPLNDNIQTLIFF